MPYDRDMKGRHFITKRGKGGHVRVTYRGRATVVPVHGDTDLAPEFLRRICKQLGIDRRNVM